MVKIWVRVGDLLLGGFLVIVGKSLVIVKFHIDEIVTILLFILSTGVLI